MECNFVRKTQAVHINGALVLMDRVQDLGDEDTAPSDITTSDISSIAFAIRHNGAVVSSGSLIVANVLFDTLKTGGGWDVAKDPDGYNFRWVIAGGTMTVKGTYKADVTFTDTAGNRFVVSWEIDGCDNL